jgi:hypothetical protein
MLKSKLFAVTLTFRASALSHQLSHTLTPAFYLRQAFVGTIRPQSSVKYTKPPQFSPVLTAFILTVSSRLQQIFYTVSIRLRLPHQAFALTSLLPLAIAPHGQHTGNRAREIPWSIVFDGVSGQKVWVFNGCFSTEDRRGATQSRRRSLVRLWQGFCQGIAPSKYHVPARLLDPGVPKIQEHLRGYPDASRRCSSLPTYTLKLFV